MESVKQPDIQILLQIDNAKVSRLLSSDQSMEYVDEGKLQILQKEEEGQKIHFIKIGNFTYSIYKQLPIYVTQYTDYRSLIFPIIEGFYVILIEDKYAENYDILDAIMGEIATQIYQNVVIDNQDNNQQQQQQQQQTPQQDQQQQQEEEKLEVKQIGIEEEQNKNQENQQQQQQQLSQIGTGLPVGQELTEEQKLIFAQQLKKEQERKQYEELNGVGKVIFKTGKFISQGIVSGATLVSKGIEKSGNYIDSKITDQKNIKIKPETMEKAKNIKQNSGKVMQVSSATAGQIMGMNVKVAQLAGKAIGGKVNKASDKVGGKDNSTLEYVKDVGRQTVETTLEVIESLEQAAMFIGKQLGQSTQQVIKKKYGEEAAELAGHGIDTVGNAGKAYKDVKSLGAKRLAKACAKETAKETAKQL